MTSDQTGSVSIIVPTRNEAENIAPLIAGIVATAISFREIIFVDDDSTDGTRDIVRSLAGAHPIVLLEQDRHDRGLAAAVLAGARAATADIILVMDADLSHPPARIGDLIAPVAAGRSDMVIGSRYVAGGSTPTWPLWRKVLSRFGAGLAYPLTNVHDSMSGFFAMSRRRLLQITPSAVGFKIAFETILRGGAGLRVIEIPIAFHDRTRGRSKMSFGIAVRFFYRWIIAVLRRLAHRQS